MPGYVKDALQQFEHEQTKIENDFCSYRNYWKMIERMNFVALEPTRIDHGGPSAVATQSILHQTYRRETLSYTTTKDNGLEKILFYAKVPNLIGF